MPGTLIEITLGESASLELKKTLIFNNDSRKDERIKSFRKKMHWFNFYFGKRNPVPNEFLYPNNLMFGSPEIYELHNRIIVGEYCDNGIIVPRTQSINFKKLYNCSPLISLIIKGDKEYISFLHTWATQDYPDLVDRQVKHWMNTISNQGDVLETVFAPRKNCGGNDTSYKNAIVDIRNVSQKTIVLFRHIGEIVGTVNTNGVYFKKCGYYLWDN